MYIYLSSSLARSLCVGEGVGKRTHAPKERERKKKKLRAGTHKARRREKNNKIKKNEKKAKEKKKKGWFRLLGYGIFLFL